MTVESDKDMCELLTEHYSMVETTRMDGVPILNKALSVAAIGFETFGDYRLGIMLTPWFMNLMLVPLKEDLIDTDAHKFGSTQHQGLPSGQFAFIVGHEEELGPYLSCSLFSPVFEFEDQEAFEQTAQAVLEEVLTPAPEQGEEEVDEEELADAEMRELWAGRVPEPEPVEGGEEASASGKDIDPSAIEEEQRPVRTLPTMSSQMSRRDVLRGLRTPEDPPEDQKEPS